MSKYGGLLNVEDEDYGYHNLSQKLNPDIPYDKLKPWGCLIHPDEIRKVWFFGNGKFLSTGGATFTNYQLKNWADMFIQSFGEMIQWHVYPKLFRHRPVTVEGAYNAPIEEYANYDDAYDFNQMLSNYNSHVVILRNKPVHRVLKWVLTNPYNASQIIDLTKRMAIRHNTGTIRSTYLLASHAASAFGNLTIPVNQYRLNGMQSLPNAYLVDYSVGYESARHVPKELVTVIVKELAASIMSAYGDGIVAGAASYSTSLSGISESLSTTMSATSSYFGARILQFTNENKEWLKQFKAKYTGMRMGFI